MKFLVFLLLAVFAHANDTALHDGDEGPAPIGGIAGPESVIRMERERLEITVGKEKTQVHATFVFHNTKPDAPAKQTVGFPDRTAEAADGKIDADFSGPIENLKTLVNGKEVKCRKLRSWVKEHDGFDEPAKLGETGSFERIWHAMDVEFPVGKDVVIERLYQVPNGAIAGDPLQRFFEYTTATGGVWKGTIGELVADVALKDGLTVDKLLWSKDGVSPAKKEWKIVSPTKLQLHWMNFEPRTEENRRGFKIAIPMEGSSEQEK